MYTEQQLSVRGDIGESHDVVSTGVRSDMHENMSGSTQQTASARVVSKEEIKRVKNLSSRLKYLTLSNPKTIKGLEFGWATAILHLAPAKYSGYTTCHRFKECAATCLYHQGRGRMPNVSNARKRKTRDLFENFEDTITIIHSEIRWLHGQLRHEGSPHLSVRLNGLSDLKWEEIPAKSLGDKTLIEASPEVQFYDYTKYRYGTRMGWTANGPINYNLTYSYDGTPEDIDNCKAVLQAGHNVNVVHNKVNYEKALEGNAEDRQMWGYQMHDNEIHDLRFLDPRPAVMCGKEKGYSDIAI